MNDYLSNLVKCFNNSNLGVNLTTILIDNEPWFIAKEVASILKYTNLKKAINRNVNEADQRMLSYEECKGLFGDSLEIEEDIEVTESLENTEDFKGAVNDPLEKPIKISNFGVKIINESGLYDLILEAKKKEAKAFRRWVTSEVLPSIRKNGSYGVAISEEDRLKLNVVNADSVEERSSALSELSQYYKAQKQALEAENTDLKRTKGQISTRREAVALAEASKASRKNKKLMKELDIKSKELDKANVDREILQTELELACSTMFTNKRVCEMITERFNIKYANSTLKAKTSKALQAIANELGENIVQRKELVNGDQHYVPYYTPRTYEVLAKRLEDDNKYLRQY